MVVIAGLGNPGPKYDGTRHNAGFEVLDALAARHGTRLEREKHQGLLAEIRFGGERVVLVKPLTYMNNSGQCVARIARYTNTPPASVLVVCDDINLPVGRLRLRMKGSAGGNNGLKSIIALLGTDAFPRLRIGVGDSEAGRDLRDHVLSTFRPEEKPIIEEAVARAAEAAEVFATEGNEQAMNRYNG